MFGSLGNIANLVKTAKDFQANLAKVQAEMATRRYEAESGAGAVRATVDGGGTVVRIAIDPKAVSDLELLEDLLISAVNAAVGRSREAMKSEMSAMTGGLNLPGLQDLVGGMK